MSCLAAMEQMGHEELIFCRMKEAGLRAIIAIHDTTLGPALGGTRMWPYPSEEEAIVDALRLSRGMTFKATAAGLTWVAARQSLLAIRRPTNPRLYFGRLAASLKVSKVGSSPAKTSALT